MTVIIRSEVVRVAAGGDPYEPDRLLPAGGTSGQVLTKATGADYDTAWETPSGGGGGIGTYDNWIPIVAEESGDLSTSTGGGYQFSMGNGDINTNFGAVIPYDYEVMAVGISTRGATTSTVEVYVGTANTTTMTASGVSVSLSSSRSAFTVAGTPYAANAGDWVTFRTTSGSGGGGVRVTAWIRPR